MKLLCEMSVAFLDDCNGANNKARRESVLKIEPVAKSGLTRLSIKHQPILNDDSEGEFRDDGFSAFADLDELEVERLVDMLLMCKTKVRKII